MPPGKKNSREPLLAHELGKQNLVLLLRHNVLTRSLLAIMGQIMPGFSTQCDSVIVYGRVSVGWKVPHAGLLMVNIIRKGYTSETMAKAISPTKTRRNFVRGNGHNKAKTGCR